MAQNTSSAVMQQRSEARDALDDFPTQPWATRALCEFLKVDHGDRLKLQTVREPAANRGHMVKPLQECFGAVEASDVHDYGAGYAVRDYLFPPQPAEVDWTITNPPFRLAERFVHLALRTSGRGVAVFVRSAFLEGAARYRDLFRLSPPTDILQFSERVVIHRGRLTQFGSSATAYCWLLWDFRQYADRPSFHWIPPGTRARLERPGDYPAEEAPCGGGGLFDG